MSDMCTSALKGERGRRLNFSVRIRGVGKLYNASARKRERGVKKIRFQAGGGRFQGKIYSSKARKIRDFLVIKTHPTFY